MSARHDTPSESSKTTLRQSAKSQWTTYRVSQIPDTYDEDSFRDALRASLLQLEQDVTLTIHSFASKGSQQRVSTITFSDTPSGLCSARADEARGKTTEWRVDIVHPSSKQTDIVYIDTHFTGFTPISPLANDEEHLIECAAAYGSRTFADLLSKLYCYTWLGKSSTRGV